MSATLRQVQDRIDLMGGMLLEIKRQDRQVRRLLRKLKRTLRGNVHPRRHHKWWNLHGQFVRPFGRIRPCIRRLGGHEQPGATISGIQTANILDNGAQAIQGNFTATGPEGDWAGLTNLNVVSHGNSGNVDLITVDATTAVQVTDNLLFGTTAALTVTGGSTVAITETNGGNFNFGITVNGGLGTTDVSVTQTQTLGSGNDAAVLINDVNGLSLTAAGTITTVTLDGLDGLFAGPSVITDNALTDLTIFNVDATNGAFVTITNNLTAPGTPTLALSLNADGSILGLPLTVTDTNNEIATLNLSEGNSASVLVFNDDGLTHVTLAGGAGAGTGVLTATFFDGATSAVNFDFSATTVNGDSFTVNRTGPE